MHWCFLSSVEESALEFLMYLVLLLKQPCQWDSYYYPFPTFRGFNCHSVNTTGDGNSWVLYLCLWIPNENSSLALLAVGSHNSL